MIRIEGIKKTFNARTRSANQVLKGVSFELPNTGLVAIFGKSGSGKTTLLNIIGGLDKQNSGKIIINDQDVKGKVDHIRNANIGFIFQNYYLEAGYTIEQIMENAMHIAGFKDKKEIKIRSDAVLKLVKMDRFKHKTADALSGGQKQRVAIARALIKGSDIILADEPTGNLDSENTFMVMDILKEISKTRLVVLVTHEVNLIHKYADSHIKLVDGEVVPDSELDAKIEVEVEKNNIYASKLNKRTLNVDNTNIDIYGDNVNNGDIEIFSSDGQVYLRPGKGVKIITDKSEKKVIFEEPVKEKLNFDEVPSFEKSTAKHNGRLFTFKKILTLKDKEEKTFSIGNIFKQIFVGCMAALTCFASFSIFESMNHQVLRKPLAENNVYLDMSSYSEIRRLKPELYDSIDFFSLNYDDGEFSYANQQSVSLVNAKYCAKSLDIDNPSKNINLSYGAMPELNEVLITRKLANDIKYQLRYDEFQNDQAMLLLTFNRNYHVSGICEGDNPYIYMNRVDYVNFLNVYSEIKFTDSAHKFFDDAFLNKANGETINSYRAEICLYEGETLSLKPNEAMIEINRSSTYLMMNDSKDADYKIDKVNRILLNSPEYIAILNSRPMFIKEFNLNRDEMSCDIKVHVSKDALRNIFTYISPNLDLINKDGSYFFEISTSGGEQLNKLNKRLDERSCDSVDITSLYDLQKEEIVNNDIKNLMIFVLVGVLLAVIYFFIEKSNSIKNSKEYGVFRAIGINKSNLLYKEMILAMRSSLITYILTSVVLITLMASRYFMMNIPISIFILITLGMIVGTSIIMIGISLIPYLFVLYKTPSEIISRYDI